MGIPSWRQGPRGAAVPGDTGGWGAATRLHLVAAAPERRGRMEEQSLGDGPRETPGRGFSDSSLRLWASFVTQSLQRPPLTLGMAENSLDLLLILLQQRLRPEALNTSRFGSNLCSATYELCDLGQAA